MAECKDCGIEKDHNNLLAYREFEGSKIYLCYKHYKARVKEDVEIMRTVCS